MKKRKRRQYANKFTLVADDTGVGRILAERIRQEHGKGKRWTAKHDDTHQFFELTRAAISYAQEARGSPSAYPWPWADRWWKPSPDPIRNLEKAGALIAAEIDRLLRKNKRDAEAAKPSFTVRRRLRFGSHSAGIWAVVSGTEKVSGKRKEWTGEAVVPVTMRPAQIDRLMGERVRIGGIGWALVATGFCMGGELTLGLVSDGVFKIPKAKNAKRKTTAKRPAKKPRQGPPKKSRASRI